MNKAYFFLLDTLKAIILNDDTIISDNRQLSAPDWQELYRLAKWHGVSAIVLDAVARLPKDYQPPFSMKMQWIGLVDSIEKRYRFQYDTAAEFAQIMLQHGIRTLVMKGLAFSTYYPKPEHRECGDLDCFLDGKFEEGNAISIEYGARNDGGDYKHTHLNFKGLAIENHRFLTNFNSTKRGKRTERILQKYIQQPSRNIGGTVLQMPIPEFNALFLIKHAQKHFIDEGITLRHILDWATFLKTEQNNLDWKGLYADMTACHINHFADIMTEICHKYLGLNFSNKEILSSKQSPLTEIVFKDILSCQKPSQHNETISNKVTRIFRRLRRMWRFRAVADESFFMLLWNTFAFSSYLKRNPKL